MTLPGVPTGVTATDGTSGNEITVNWNPVANVDSYEIWRSNSDVVNTATRVTADVIGTTYSDITVTPALQYYYWIKSVNSSGTVSLFSQSDSGWRHLVAPGNLSANTDNSQRVLLNWQASAGAANYRVLRGLNDNVVGAQRDRPAKLKPFQRYDCCSGSIVLLVCTSSAASIGR